MRLSNYRPIILVILSLAVLWSVPASKASPNLGNLFPPSFEVNGMVVSAQGDVAAGSFYALDPTIVPWDLTNPIYKYVGVTLIVSNLNSSSLSSTAGINVTSAANGFAPYRVILVIEGVQRNTLSIVSDVQTVFGMAPGSFQALVSNPLTLPVSVFGANITSNPYSNFVNKFELLTSAKSAMIGKYTSSLLQTSSSAIIFNSLESLTYPVAPAFSASGIASAALGIGAIGAAIAPAFGLNSTGVAVVHKKVLTFSLPQDYTMDFGALVGQSGGIYSATNETFVASLPGGAQVKSFNPANMLVQSSTGSTLVVGVFPWVGTAQRLVPDVSVTFHYPAFDSPYLTATWTTTPSTFYVGQPFNLTLGITNTGAMDANNLHFTLGFSGVVLLGQQSVTSLQFGIASLLKGATYNRLFNFQSFNPNPTFTLSAYFLDTSNYVYHWDTQFSPAPNVRQNGPLTVTKNISPTGPTYGQNGTVTVSIHNTNLTATYFNLEDLNPDAEIFLYPQGVGNTPQQPTPCVSVTSFPPVTANTTYFTFRVSNGVGCAPAVLTHVLLQPFGRSMQLVVSPNMLLGGGEGWSPLKPYLIPGGPVSPFSQVTLRLTFQNSVNLTSTNQVSYSGPLPQFQNPKASYLGLYCLPCSVPTGGSTTIAGALVNASGKPIASAPVVLSYKLTNNTLRPITTLITNSTGGYSTTWLGVSTLPVGSYRLIANYTGSLQNNAEGTYIQFYVITPTSILPGGTLTVSYPYFFNVTGAISITPERIAYSSQVNATGTGHQLIGEYLTQSSAIPVTVGSPTIVPVVDMTMNVTKISILYAAQNQSLVQVNLRVTNTGPQLANNVIVSSLIPQSSRTNSSGGPSIPFWLPVVSLGPSVSEASNLKTVSFTVASLPSGQSYSTWYVVKANTTNLFATSSNVTAQSGSNQYKFYYTGPLLGVYPSASTIALPQIGLLKTYATIDPAVVANKTSTIVSVHMYNAGNVTYNNIIAMMPNLLGPGLSFPILSKIVPNMAPGASQTVNFTATATVATLYFSSGVFTYSFSGSVSYNQSSTKGFQSGFSQAVPIYDPTIAGFNPSLRVIISPLTSQVSAGATNLVILTVTNTGASNVTNFSYSLQAYSPLFNPTGPSSPETSYGSYFTGWPYSLGAGQSINFRIGIQTRAGGSYPVYGLLIDYQYSPPGSTASSQVAQISASSAALVTATDTTPPTASIPWSSPFAPTSSDRVHVWTQVYDGSGVSSVNIEYSTDRLTWTSVPMTPLFGSYAKGQNVPVQQPFFGDIYNVTIPPIGPGAAVFYRIRSIDSLGNGGLQDNNGNDYVYFIQGGNSWLFPNLASGTNLLLNGTQYVPGIKTSVFLNVSTPIAVQVIQLGLNPGGPPPTGLSALGIYTQVNANISITLNARVRFYYTPSQIQGLNTSTIAPYYWNGASWIPLTNVSVNSNQNYVEGTVNHFSLFAVFAKPASSQPPPTTQPASQPTFLYIGLAGLIAAIAIIGGIFLTKKRKHGTSSLLPTPASPSPISGSPASV
ncbi:MAG TPA: carboxypeptidase-like regulatory domain-containing protein [Candidatus Bathyarchaeia archaeon]|nr:carboxypeptidase-like regulatory domain-containing protein [Candidatus Bathyarchaeia archaeon]